MVSEEKLTVNLIEDTLYMIRNFSCAAFKILPLSLAFDSLALMCLSVDLWVYPAWI